MTDRSPLSLRRPTFSGQFPVLSDREIGPRIGGVRCQATLETESETGVRTLSAVSYIGDVISTDVTLRPYGGRDDLAGMATVINARVAEEGEGEHASVASLAEQYDHLQRCDPATDILMAVDDRGAIVGYARVMWDDVSEGYRAYYVAFEAISTIDGLGQHLLHWGIDRATAIAAAHDVPDQRIQAWANDGGPRESIVRASGFAPFQWSAFMVRPHLRDIPDRPLPSGLEIRPVDPSHLRAIWEADIEAFRDHPGYVEQTETDWERFLDEAAPGTDLWQIAWAGGTVAGQVRTYVNDGEAEQLGRRRAWTENISTPRNWRAKGVASALIAASLRQLAQLGFDEAALGVNLDNPTGALGVYERMGYELVMRQTVYSRSI